MNLLSKMQENVDLLWQKVIYAKSEDEKEALRKEYFRALDAYKKQCLISEELEFSKKSTQPTKNTDLKDAALTALQKTSTEAQNAKTSEPKLRFGPNPFDYPDYFEFLEAYFSPKGEMKPSTSLELSKATGISEDSLQKILCRAKKVDAKENQKIIKFLDYPELESEFLNVLYSLSVVDSGLERTKAMEQLNRFSSFKKKNPLGYEVWRYMSHWYYPAIREMSMLPDFKADPNWIQSKLVRFVSVPDIRKCLDFLVGAEFIKLEKDGKVIARHKHMNCSGGLYRLGLRNFHKEILELASSAITSLPSDKRMLLAHTVAVPEAKKEALFQILNETIEKVRALGAGESSNDDIFHVELVAMPLTQKKETFK